MMGMLEEEDTLIGDVNGKVRNFKRMGQRVQEVAVLEFEGSERSHKRTSE